MRRAREADEAGAVDEKLTAAGAEIMDTSRRSWTIELRPDP